MGPSLLLYAAEERCDLSKDYHPMRHGAGGAELDAHQPQLVGAEPELDALLCVVVVAGKPGGAEPELDAHQQQLVVVAAAGGAAVACAVPGEGDKLLPSSPERRKISTRRWQR